MADDYNSDSDELHNSDSDHDKSQESEESQEESSSDDEATNGLLDIEASEADSDLDDFEAQHGFSYVNDSYLEPFTKFMQLPVELREMVWKAFCPDLTAGPRVFDVFLLPSDRPKLVPGPCLEEQTAPMRTLLAVHRESRALGLKSSPHEFTLVYGARLPYHEERDVIHFTLPETYVVETLPVGQELGGSPQNIAVGWGWSATSVVDLLSFFSHVKRFFVIFDDAELDDVSTKGYAWVVSDEINHYYTETQEEGEAGLMVDIKRLFCWPDLNKHRDFAEQVIAQGNTDHSSFGHKIDQLREWLAELVGYATELARDREGDRTGLEAVDQLQDAEVWPMIRFDTDSALQHFHAMKAWDRPWDEWDSGSASGSSDDEPDEYESDGIDDRSVNDYLSTDDEDDLPGQHNADDSEDEGDSDQLLGRSFEINGDLDLAAQFSGEEDAAEDNDGLAGASGSENDDGSRSRASRPKRRVVASDSEEESATETEEAPPRPASNRRGRAVLAESEDEDDGDEEDASDPRPARSRARRVRAPPTDSEDEDEDDVPPPPRAQNRRARALPAESDDDDDESDSEGGGARAQQTDSSSSSEESSDEEDDEPAPAKRMSLAKRLKMEAQASRQGQSNYDDSDADGNEYGGASDDDEGDEDGASDPGGIVMGMAGEDDGEGGESEEDY